MTIVRTLSCKKILVSSSVADPDPDILWASWIQIPDPLVRGMDPDPSNIKQK